MERIDREDIEAMSEDVMRHVAAIIDHGQFDGEGTLGEQVAARLQSEGLLADRWERPNVEALAREVADWSTGLNRRLA